MGSNSKCRYYLFIIVIFATVICPFLTDGAYAGLDGDYFIEDEKGRVGKLTIVQKTPDKIQFNIYVAVPAICGVGREGQVKLENNLADFSGEDCDTLTMVFERGAVKVSTRNCGFKPDESCAFDGIYTNAQSEPPRTEKEKIKDIRLHYAAVNMQTDRLETVEKSLEGFSTEGGQLMAYLDEGAIRKIVVNHYGETGRYLEEYYYWLGRLFFYFEVFFQYDKPFGKVVSQKEDRYYFYRGKMIRWLDPKKEKVSPSNPEFTKKQKEIMDMSEKYMKGVKSENPVIVAE